MLIIIINVYILIINVYKKYILYNIYTSIPIKYNS